MTTATETTMAPGPVLAAGPKAVGKTVNLTSGTLGPSFSSIVGLLTNHPIRVDPDRARRIAEDRKQKPQ